MKLIMKDKYKRMISMRGIKSNSLIKINYLLNNIVHTSLRNAGLIWKLTLPNS